MTAAANADRQAAVALFDAAVRQPDRGPLPCRYDWPAAVRRAGAVRAGREATWGVGRAALAARRARPSADCSFPDLKKTSDA